jgi:hypothetical protein
VGSGKISQVPDFRKYVQWFQTWPILSRGEGTIEACAPKVDTTYAVKDDPKTDCASMRLIPSGGAQEVHGPFLPITSALYFKALGKSCLGDLGASEPCGYYLNMSTNGTDRELHAALVGPALDSQLLNENSSGTALVPSAAPKP